MSAGRWFRANQGEGALHGVLVTIAPRSATTSAKAGPKAIYGRLYEWLAYTTPVVDHGPIRTLLREHFLETLAVDPDELLLGERVLERRLHSVQSLAEQTGLHRKRLWKILVQAGLASEGAWDQAGYRLVFPARLAEDFCRDLPDAVSLHELPEVLDCSRDQAESLYRVGVLKPVVDRDLGQEGMQLKEHWVCTVGISAHLLAISGSQPTLWNAPSSVDDSES